MPQLLTRGNHSRHRGETVCKKLATLTVRNLIFSRCQIWSIFTVFRYFSIVFDRFRSYTHREALENVRSCLRQRLGVAWGLRDGSSCAQPVNICRLREGPWAQNSMDSNSAARGPVVNGLRQTPNKSGNPKFRCPDPSDPF